MFAKTLSRGLIVAAAFVAMNSMADTLPDAKIAEMMSFKTMDKNHDGMVSKAEYLEMAGKVFDMKAKEMKGKDGMMTADQYAKFLKGLEYNSGQ